MLGSTQQAWLKDGLIRSRARWNIIAQQTLMAQNNRKPGPGQSFWTDGWDGYPMARARLFDTLGKSGAANPLVISGDVHTFYAAELRRDFYRPESNANPVIATEFCGTSVTSSSRPQKRTQEYVDMNPHIQYGRSDKRGFMLLEVAPSATTTHFIGLDNVHDARSTSATLASFRVEAGRPGINRIA